MSSTSQGAFDKFGKTLMPILQQLGVDPGQPSVMPMHKVMVPPAKSRVAPEAREGDVGTPSEALDLQGALQFLAAVRVSFQMSLLVSIAS